MRRSLATALTVVGLAATAGLGLVGTASAAPFITQAQCTGGGGRVLMLPAPHNWECVGGTYSGDWVYPPAP